MLFDLAALALLALFVALGAARGAVASGLGLAGLLLGYAAGAAAALRSGPDLADALGWPAWLGAAAAGSAAFALAFAAAAIVGIGLRRRDRERAADGRSALDRLGGALLGAARGALVVLLVGVGALWFDAWRALARDDEAAATADSPLRSLTRRAVRAGAETALSDAPGGELAARVLTQPAETLTGLRALLEDPRLGELAADRTFWIHVERGALDAALTRWSYRRVSRDAELRDELARLGVVGAPAAADGDAFDAEARAVLTELGPRLKRLREDPELQRLAADPEVAARIRSGDYLSLLRHPGFQRVVRRTLGPPS